ncbi:protein ifh1 [Saccharomyces cerevisiae]|nr:Ifh1p [Saccharomyces cerevisiae YJM1202]AJV59748.1 Ifh1p [Saccharomyces cerevisiae YJM1389]AJV71349.1 Ifh1p [Saccharomyces cerevisiae YJM1592]AJV81991.1 Ifh1p [Saccharomyces cerevisiae YJM689]GAX71311.1 coactivator, regulates transcription of ribosomal protein genes [Saccharomyces cerevisiae]
MAGKKSPRKSTINHSTHSGKLPANIKRLIKKGESDTKSRQSPPTLSTTRPRRFSLIYSSESSLSDVSDSDKNKSTNPHKIKRKAKNISNNSQGKKSKLIQRQIDNDDEGTESSDYQAVTDGEESENEEEESEEEEDDDDEDDDDDDDDGSDSDSDSETSSDDENIDFVKLTAQRKKRAMKALSAMNTNSNTLYSSRENSNKNKSVKLSPKKENEEEQKEEKEKEKEEQQKQQESNKKEVNGSGTTTTQQALSFKFKKEDDGISFGNGNEGYNEDIGEEVLDLKNKENNGNEEDKLDSKVMLGNNDELRFPNISESDESEYDIDQDAYFDVINNEDSHGEIGTDLETGEDDLPILEEEEQNIVSELQNDDELSFDGSIHEEGSDPVEDAENKFLQNEYNQENGYDEEDDEEDEIMSDFDMPFYEDPKFANLYYYGDGSEPKLSLSTSLPLMLNDEKLSKLKKKEAKKREQEERKQRRKLYKKTQKPSTRTTSNVDNDEYIFNVFFQSDDENSGHKSKKGRHKSGKSHIEHKNKGSNLIKSNDDLEPSTHSTVLNSGKYDSSDDEYDNILLDVAHMPSDDECSESETSHDADTDEELRALDSDSLDIGTELDDDYEDDDDDSSVTNVFIDIDDLDPDSFYFHYDSDGSSSLISSNSDKENSDGSKDCKHDLLETVVYVDDESTDEDDNLPPPSSRSKNIGSKAKEIVSSNVVGLRPPKLGTWETDNKPFSIIDGLSTKSLYALIQEHQQLREQHQRAQTPDVKREGSANVNNGDELTLNELLNMSELEDDSPSHTDDMENNYNDAINSKSTNGHAADWYEVPKVPLSAFRNKGINAYEEDEYMIPANSNRKVPIGYIGNERTRKKIDKMKELQRKKTEKKRQLKKKKKLLKIRKQRQKAIKEQETMNLQLGINGHEIIGNNNSHSDINTGTDFTTNENTPMNELPSHAPEDASLIPHNSDLAVDSNTRKNSTKSVGLDEIHEILGKDENDLLPVGDINGYDAQEGHVIEDTDADILASLTAPVQFDNTLSHENSNSMWRRRQSMVEAAAENLRFTKNGLFSESALADIEGIMGNDVNHSFEFNDVLQ